ncbi:MAG: spore coat protein [Bacillota bacterium]
MQGQIPGKEMMQILLDHHKSCSVHLLNLAMECANFELRNEVLKTLDMSLRHQEHIFELMSHLGWYQTTPASPGEIESLRNTSQQMITA